MEMYFCPLYSGSSGNALFCQYGNTRLLIDAGKTGSCLTAALQKILAATRRFETLAKKKLEDLLATGEFEEKMVSELERLTGLSSNAPGSAE